MALRPLLFLTSKSLINGLRRALTSPKRLITTLAILAYYFWLFVRPILYSTSHVRTPSMFDSHGFRFPAMEVLDAFAFALFAVLSLTLLMGIFGYRSGFKPADVDVLFPTPVNPRTVLMFRIVRDYLGTLLVPMILILLVWRPLTVNGFFHDVPHPNGAAYAFKALTIGLLLQSTAWVGINYSLSLYLNRNDRNSDARKKVVSWAIAVLCVAVGAYIAVRASRFESLQDFVQLTQVGFLRAFFFTATPATQMVMGTLQDNPFETVGGALSLIAISAFSLYLALRQAAWVYDEAAVKGFGAESLRQLQRRGDIVGIVAESARRGKVKAYRPGWLQRLRLKGFWALLWKDALIQWRTVRAMILIFTLVGLLLVVVPFVAGPSSRSEGIGYLILVMEGFVAFMVATMTSQSGFAELLRRVDLQKPFPFGPQKIVMAEVLAKAFPAMLIPAISSLLALALFPETWKEALAGAMFFPTMGAVICALVCIIVLLFPEIDDAGQRGFRGLMMLLGLAIVGAPGVLLLVGIAALTKNVLLAAIPAAGLNLVVAFGLTVIGGSLYAGFNPSE